MKNKSLRNSFGKKPAVILVIAVFFAAAFMPAVNSLRQIPSSEQISGGTLLDEHQYSNELQSSYQQKDASLPKPNPVPLDSRAWWNTNWDHRKNITIDHTKVDTNILRNFPVLVKCIDTDLLYEAQPDGDDIVFTDASGNKLNHEIEKYNSTTGELIAWVNVTSLSPSVDTVISMYFGNEAATNQQNPSGVWDGNYVMVQHLEESTGNTMYDSTTYGNNGISTNTAFTTTGKMDGARLYNQSDKIVTNNFPHSATQLTAEAWMYRDTTAFIYVLCKGTYSTTSDWMIYLRTGYAGAGIDFRINNGAKSIRTGTTYPNTWFYLTATYNAGNAFLYYNGTQIGSSTGWPAISNNYPHLGMGNDYVGTNGNENPMTAVKLDELRVSKIARNSSWIKTSYNTMSSPSTFMTFGPKETRSGPIKPGISNPIPANESLNVKRQSVCSITVSDDNGGVVNVTFFENTTGSWVAQQISRNVSVASPAMVSWDKYVNASLFSMRYWWKVNVSDGTGLYRENIYGFTTTTYETTPPAVALDFAGNPNDKGGPYYLPGTSTLAPEGYYTNDSYQQEKWMSIKCTATDNAAIDEVWLHWQNGTQWTNTSYRLTHTTGNTYELNMSAGVAPGYKYSFDLLAVDTSGNTALYQWLKAGADTTTVDDRRYVQLGGTPTNVSYTPYYFYPAQYNYVNGYGSGHSQYFDDPFHHDQGPDGTLTDTGYLLSALPTNVIQERHCVMYVGYWFDETVTALSGTIQNIYQHFWWNTTDKQLTVAYGKYDGGLYRTNNWGQSYLTNTAMAHSNVSYNSKMYSLESALMQIASPQSFIDNDIYEFFIEHYTPGSTNPTVINNRSILSFVIFNVPDNTTLQGRDTDHDGLADYQELYVYYTNPFVQDTDNDGVNDYYEKLSGSDPNNYKNVLSPCPILSSESPPHLSKNQLLNPRLSITVSDLQGDTMTITFRTNASGSWQTIGTNSSASNGSYSQIPTTMNNYNTNYYWSVNCTDGPCWTNETYRFTTCFDPSDWKYYKKITVNHSLVDGSLTNYPILISTTDLDLANHAQSDARDVQFWDSTNTTQCNHEIEKYSDATGEFIAWVNIPHLSAIQDTILWMKYGNPECDTQENIPGTWNSNFIMVQHLNETGITVNDSTVYRHNGTSTGTTFSSSCKIDGGRVYDDNDYITVNNFGDYTNMLTAEAWVYRDTTSIINVFSEGTNYNAGDWILYLRTASTNEGIDFGVNNHGSYIRQGTTPQNCWFYLTATYNAGSVILYVNGTQVGSGTIATSINTNYAALGLGNDYDGGQPWASGKLDEMRVSNIARNSSWIKTSFNTMNKPASFIKFGPEEELESQTDFIPPTITNVDTTPDKQKIEGYINITANITDNVGVTEVYLHTIYPDLTSTNISITTNKIGNTYYYNTSYTTPGTYTSTFWASDAEDNTATSSPNQYAIVRWKVLLNFSESFAGKWDQIVFGEVDDASDGQDNYDVPQPPSAPSPPYISAYFDAGLSDPYQNLWEDYRQYPDDSKEWDVYVRCNTTLPVFGTTVVTITWQTTEVNDSEYATGSVVLYDCSDNSAVADMMRKSSYSFTATFDILYHFRIQCDQIKPDTYKISLNTTWNLISLPFNESKAKTSILVRNNSIDYTWTEAVSHGIVLNHFYDWNGETYGLSDSLTPGQGYWMWAYYNCDIIFTSVKTEDVRLSALQAGWNIMGLPCNSSLLKETLYVRYNDVDFTWTQATTNDNPTGGPIILGFIYGWNRIDQMYLLCDSFTPGNGYWMYAYKDCLLKKGGS